jgi:hypothetical protein
LKQLKVEGVIVTDSSEEGKDINMWIRNVLKEEECRDWMVEEVESFQEIEGVCDRYMEMIEERSKINIEYKNIR